ncbi:hypothetical protein ACFQYP_19835 [Nonomuraea antimicrobica]
MARASGVLSFAALIASDSGMPDLAAELCWRQHKIFTEADSLNQDIAVMSLMPLVNIARLLIREGDGSGALQCFSSCTGPPSSAAPPSSVTTPSTLHHDPAG